MRATDRILALVLALAGFALGILTVVEIVYSAVGNTGHLLLPYESVATFLRGHQWNEPLVVVAGCALALLGLLLLIMETRRRRPAFVVLRPSRDDVTAAMSNRSLRRVLTQATTAVPGISGAEARVRRGKVVLSTRSNVKDTEDVQARAEAAATEALDGLDLSSPPKLRVTVTSTKGGS